MIWQDLADYFDMLSDQRHGFAPGREPQGVWEWLEVRQRLPELLDALRYIDRTDIVVEVLAPPVTPSSPEVTWQGSPFPEWPTVVLVTMTFWNSRPLARCMVAKSRQLASALTRVSGFDRLHRISG